MRCHLSRAVSVSLVLGLVLTACTPGMRAARRMGLPGHWARFRYAAGVVDLAGPRGDGSFTVAAAGHLSLLSRTGALRPFARGPGGYSTATGPEPYIAMAGDGQAAGAWCSFGTGTVFALQPGPRPGVMVIGADGRASRFAALPAALAPTGITFDSTGLFEHELLVTAKSHASATVRRAATTVLAIDCAGRARVITSRAPAMEGGIAVAPTSFGRYRGDLIAPDETSGRIFAVEPNGTVLTLVTSGLPRGGDIGIESTGFVPPGFNSSGAAYVADRFSKGNKHPGTNSILRLRGPELVKAGIRPGDLLAATEASARTIAVRCASTCTVKDIAVGPAISHAEGHIVFTRSG